MGCRANPVSAMNPDQSLHTGNLLDDMLRLANIDSSSAQSPSSIMMPWFQNGTCDPFHPESQPCTLGNLVEYSINVSSTADVAAGLQFAQSKNIRLAIKNTGHEYVSIESSRILSHAAL